MVNVKAKDKKSYGGDLTICRCEEVSKEEILGAIRSGAGSIAAIARRTSAGMGLCQGRTCQRLIAQILNEVGVPMEVIKPRTIRPPLRPVPVDILGGEEKRE